MKIDLEYLKELLTKFEASERAYTNIFELQKLGLDHNSEEFIFHLQLLWDKNFVRTENLNGDNFGLSRRADGLPSWSSRNLVLTYDGHEFLEALRNDGVWSKLKSDFREAGISTIVDVSKTLLGEYLKKKLGLG